MLSKAEKSIHYSLAYWYITDAIKQIREIGKDEGLVGVGLITLTENLNKECDNYLNLIRS